LCPKALGEHGLPKGRDQIGTAAISALGWFDAFIRMKPSGCLVGGAQCEANVSKTRNVLHQRAAVLRTSSETGKHEHGRSDIPTEHVGATRVSRHAESVSVTGIEIKSPQRILSK
jgi:hypothetical protein